MKRNIFLFIVALGLLLLLSGCSECKVGGDCAAKPGKAAKCVDKKCSYVQACGGTECAGKVGKYLEKTCLNNKCYTAAAKATPVRSADTISEESQRITLFKILADYEHDSPFNIDKSAVKANYKLDKVDDAARNIILRKIQAISHSAKKDRRGLYPADDVVVVYGEKEFNRNLWDTLTEVSVAVPLKAAVDDKGEEKTLSVKTIIEYEEKNTRGEWQHKSKESEKELQFVLVDPTVPVTCTPAGCDDANPCTRDSCMDSLCSNEPIPDCKGNFICEKGENKCTAPEDCGSCRGKAGQYTAYSCIDGGCAAVVTDTAILQKKVNSYDISIPSARDEAIRLKMTLTYDEPFAVSVSSITADFKVLSLRPDVSGFSITNIELKHSNELLGSMQTALGFSAVDALQSVALKPAYALSETEQQKKPVLYFYYSYSAPDTRTGEPRQYTNQVYQHNMGELLFLNVKG